MKKLETLLNDISFESLPPEWSAFELAHFSPKKSLWDYQQKATQNAIKALWKYYSEPQAHARKSSFFNWYKDNQIEIAALSVGKKRANIALLSPYYPIDSAHISYEHFINRMCFWMATGSGKTLVAIKLIEVLWWLMQQGCIPSHDILMLTHREDLIKQLRLQVDEYNAASNPVFIRLHELKEYDEVKRGFLSLLRHQEIDIFYYRSDNLSNEQKERIIDFRNYDNDGRWYILLDEAHKGDKAEADSKRQLIYNIMSRNGFLFNFSATFIDNSDKLTTAAEFNLASFIEAGYGKHIAILKSEYSAFHKGNEDFNDEEKQKIILQSLLALTYIHRSREGLKSATSATLYHRPLMLALVNSVNTEDADLKLFFAQLERIAKGDLSQDIFQRAKKDLWNELQTEPEWLYEGTSFVVDSTLFNSLKLGDVLQTVFNGKKHGAIEVLARPSNDKELAFKLQTATAPFALIRIGTNADWLKNYLAGYEIVKGFEDESFFEQLNEDESAVNLLMGSRSFYEGWDSNRPNVITFINIGMGMDAKKFILQSVGRGARIEPQKGKRKRMASLATSGEVDHLLFNQAKPFLSAIETLLIFGTRRDALESVFKELDQEKEREESTEIALEVNSTAIAGNPLLIPTYRSASRPLIEQHAPRKFPLAQEELVNLENYLAYLGDERLLMAHHSLQPRQIGYLEKSLAADNIYYDTSVAKKFGNVKNLLPRLARHFDIFPSELESVKTLESEINHYLHIRVLLKDIEELRSKIEKVSAFKNPVKQKDALKTKFALDNDLDAYTLGIEHLALITDEDTFSPPGKTAILTIKNIAAHYYVPVLMSEDEKIDYIQHIIHVKSEVKFIKQLDAYLKKGENLFQSFDWWMFSRTDETLDKVIIPYYDPTQNKMRDFHPDFIFWLKRGNNYFILFVDPKGMSNADYQYKIDGYKEIFVDPATGNLRTIPHSNMNVRVALAMHTSDANQAPQKYSDFWYDNPASLLRRLTDPWP